MPKSIYHIPLRHGRGNQFGSPFAPSEPTTVNYHHGPVCEKANEKGECLKYYEGALYYRGGEVLKEPKLYLIFYGSNWNGEEDKRWKGALVNTLRGMTTEYQFDETYQRILHQYWDEQTEPKQISNTITVGGEWTYEAIAAPQNLTEENVELQVNFAIETNHWTRERNAVFLVMEPTGSAWNETFANKTECGYHYVDRWGDVYGLIPNLNDRHFNTGCVVNTVQHAETETATHEYMEAVTDPHPGTTPGWTNEQGFEIADICDAEPEKLNEPLSIYVSAVWGNKEKTCVIQDPPEEGPVPPTAATEAATGVSYHQATLHGSVNPNGGPEPHYYFEYGTSTSYGTDSPTPPGPGVARGTSSVPVSTSHSGLKAGTKYHFRLRSETWAGTSYGADREFTTPIPPPAVATEAATEVRETHASLNGWVNPEEFSTTYQFEYWQVGKATEVTKIPTTAESVGAGTSNVKVKQVPTLAANTEYIYRITATNAGGTTQGTVASFVTGPVLENHSTPNPSGAVQSILYGVSCTSTSWCLGVGYDKNGAGEFTPLAETWNGSAWQLSTPVTPTGGKETSLKAVACSSATACTAVGSFVSSSKNIEPLVERWNGSTWAVQSTPSAPTGHFYEMLGVACPSTTSCVAVGYDETKPLETVPLAERWNGSEWKVVATPGKGNLQGVSCTATNACTAVGQTGYGGEPLAERWNGTEWSTQTTAKITQGGLQSVSCASSTSCVAVGASGGISGSASVNVSETWNGTEWSTVSVPAPEGAKESTLYGVSCSSTTSCIAVGTSGELIEKPTVLADTWNGKEWRRMTLPLPSGTTRSQLYSASCASAYCTADGSYENSSGTLLTLEGTTGLPGAQTEAASSITATEATLNATVDPNGRETTYHYEYGETTSYGTTTPIPDGKLASLAVSEKVGRAITGLQPEKIYHYRLVATNPSGTIDGTDHTFTTLALPWSVDSTPNPSGAVQSILYGVSCTSTSWCLGVGYDKNSAGEFAPLAETWNGTSWQLSTPVTPTGAKETSLKAVSCSSSTACTAVGSYVNSSKNVVPLVERWNGSTWAVQSTPEAPSGQFYELLGVACSSATACITVGYNGIPLESTPLAESWNGSEWKVVATPGKGNLQGVSCTASDACTAVGQTGFGGEPLAERWNGTEWSTQTTAKITQGGLQSVSCASSTSCIAVGASGGIFGSASTNVSESWNGTEWSVVSVPSPTGAKESILRGVACSSTTSCVAVGTYGELIEKPTALADTWNGKEWRILSAPLPSGANRSQLYAASCTGPYCTIDGYYENSAGTLLTLVDSN